MTRNEHLFCAVALSAALGWLLHGCGGGDPIALQRGAALQPPVACCTPRPLPYAYVCSPTTPPGWGQVRVCSSAAPFYASPVCAMQTANAPDVDFASYGWSVNGWHVASILLDADAGAGWRGTAGWDFEGGPLYESFSASAGINYLTQWTQ